MQKNNEGKFVIICENYNGIISPKKLRFNDRKIFDKLIQNYKTDIIILWAKVEYDKRNNIDSINISEKYEKILGGYDWHSNIKTFNLNYDYYKEDDEIGGQFYEENERYNDENYYTMYTNKVNLMLVSFRM